MLSIKKRGLLATAACVLLTGMFSAAMDHPDHKGKGCDGRNYANCRPVPDGGSAVVYVLGAGIICLGGLLIRSRLAKKAS